MTTPVYETYHETGGPSLACGPPLVNGHQRGDPPLVQATASDLPEGMPEALQPGRERDGRGHDSEPSLGDRVNCRGSFNDNIPPGRHSMNEQLLMNDQFILPSARESEPEATTVSFPINYSQAYNQTSVAMMRDQAYNPMMHDPNRAPMIARNPETARTGGQSTRRSGSGNVTPGVPGNVTPEMPPGFQYPGNQRESVEQVGNQNQTQNPVNGEAQRRVSVESQHGNEQNLRERRRASALTERISSISGGGAQRISVRSQNSNSGRRMSQPEQESQPCCRYSQADFAPGHPGPRHSQGDSNHNSNRRPQTDTLPKARDTAPETIVNDETIITDNDNSVAYCSGANDSGMVNDDSGPVNDDSGIANETVSLNDSAIANGSGQANEESAQDSSVHDTIIGDSIIKERDSVSLQENVRIQDSAQNSYSQPKSYSAEDSVTQQANIHKDTSAVSLNSVPDFRVIVPQNCPVKTPDSTLPACRRSDESGSLIRSFHANGSFNANGPNPNELRKIAVKIPATKEKLKAILPKDVPPRAELHFSYRDGVWKCIATWGADDKERRVPLQNLQKGHNSSQQCIPEEGSEDVPPGFGGQKTADEAGNRGGGYIPAQKIPGNHAYYPQTERISRDDGRSSRGGRKGSSSNKSDECTPKLPEKGSVQDSAAQINFAEQTMDEFTTALVNDKLKHLKTPQQSPLQEGRDHQGGENCRSYSHPVGNRNVDESCQTICLDGSLHNLTQKFTIPKEEFMKSLPVYSPQFGLPAHVNTTVPPGVAHHIIAEIVDVDGNGCNGVVQGQSSNGGSVGRLLASSSAQHLSHPTSFHNTSDRISTMHNSTQQLSSHHNSTEAFARQNSHNRFPSPMQNAPHPSLIQHPPSVQRLNTADSLHRLQPGAQKNEYVDPRAEQVVQYTDPRGDQAYVDSRGDQVVHTVPALVSPAAQLTPVKLTSIPQQPFRVVEPEPVKIAVPVSQMPQVHRMVTPLQEPLALTPMQQNSPVTPIQQHRPPEHRCLSPFQPIVPSSAPALQVGSLPPCFVPGNIPKFTPPPRDASVTPCIGNNGQETTPRSQRILPEGFPDLVIQPPISRDDQKLLEGRNQALAKNAVAALNRTGRSLTPIRAPDIGANTTPIGANNATPVNMGRDTRERSVTPTGMVRVLPATAPLVGGFDMPSTETPGGMHIPSTTDAFPISTARPSTPTAATTNSGVPRITPVKLTPIISSSCSFIPPEDNQRNCPKNTNLIYIPQGVNTESSNNTSIPSGRQPASLPAGRDPVLRVASPVRESKIFQKKAKLLQPLQLPEWPLQSAISYGRGAENNVNEDLFQPLQAGKLNMPSITEVQPNFPSIQPQIVPLGKDLNVGSRQISQPPSLGPNFELNLQCDPPLEVSRRNSRDWSGTGAHIPKSKFNLQGGDERVQEKVRESIQHLQSQQETREFHVKTSIPYHLQKEYERKIQPTKTLVERMGTADVRNTMIDIQCKVMNAYSQFQNDFECKHKDRISQLGDKLYNESSRIKGYGQDPERRCGSLNPERRAGSLNPEKRAGSLLNPERRSSSLNPPSRRNSCLGAENETMAPNQFQAYQDRFPCTQMANMVSHPTIDLHSVNGQSVDTRIGLYPQHHQHQLQQEQQQLQHQQQCPLTNIVSQPTMDLHGSQSHSVPLHGRAEKPKMAAVLEGGLSESTDDHLSGEQEYSATTTGCNGDQDNRPSRLPSHATTSNAKIIDSALHEQHHPEQIYHPKTTSNPKITQPDLVVNIPTRDIKIVPNCENIPPLPETGLTIVQDDGKIIHYTDLKSHPPTPLPPTDRLINFQFPNDNIPQGNDLCFANMEHQHQHQMVDQHQHQMVDQHQQHRPATPMDHQQQPRYYRESEQDGHLQPAPTQASNYPISNSHYQTTSQSTSRRTSQNLANHEDFIQKIQERGHQVLNELTSKQLSLKNYFSSLGKMSRPQIDSTMLMGNDTSIANSSVNQFQSFSGRVSFENGRVSSGTGRESLTDQFLLGQHLGGQPHSGPCLITPFGGPQLLSRQVGMMLGGGQPQVGLQISQGLTGQRQ